MAAITTPEQVLTTTGATVTASDIATAAGFVEAVVGVDLSLDPLPYVKRDVRNLRAAVMWQAAHMVQHPELADREPGIASASVNGVSVSYTTGTDGIGDRLSPFSRMALRRLSWRGSRTVRMVPGREPAAGYAERQTLLLDGADGHWQPLS